MVVKLNNVRNLLIVVKQYMTGDLYMIIKWNKVITLDDLLTLLRWNKLNDLMIVVNWNKLNDLMINVKIQDSS